MLNLIVEVGLTASRCILYNAGVPWPSFQNIFRAFTAVRKPIKFFPTGEELCKLSSSNTRLVLSVKILQIIVHAFSELQLWIVASPAFVLAARFMLKELSWRIYIQSFKTTRKNKFEKHFIFKNKNLCTRWNKKNNFNFYISSLLEKKYLWVITRDLGQYILNIP